MTFDPLTYRKTMGFFATGVAVLTIPGDEGDTVGVTINSLTSVSLDPALILFCIKRHADSYARVMGARNFTINILNQDQKDLALFCTRRGGGKLNADQLEISNNGQAQLIGALATLECQTTETHKGGDHTIIVAKVKALTVNADKDPLIFFRSHFTSTQDSIEDLQKVS